jgi:hypothetical protein
MSIPTCITIKIPSPDVGLRFAHKYPVDSDSCEKMQQAASLQTLFFVVGALLAAPCLCYLETVLIVHKPRILIPFQ